MKRKYMRIGMEVVHQRGPDGDWRPGVIHSVPRNAKEYVEIATQEGIVYRDNDEIEPPARRCKNCLRAEAKEKRCS